MDQCDDFVQFAAKVQQVLQYPDRKTVLQMLRNLAEGKEVLISGAVINPLSGLGQEAPGDIPNSDYRETMAKLLTWGLRRFPVLPSVNGMHLWASMSILDGPEGYNQR
jgi:hypothetical protein